MKKIADYEALQPLAAGDAALTWLCAPSDRLDLSAPSVVVKISEQPAGEQELQRVADELRLYASASSPHLVAVYDVGLWNDHLYVAKEFCPLGSLGAVSSPAERTAVLAVADAARAAHALHEIGLAHRNIKPSNIMLQPEGGKLDDLGVLHVVSPGQTATRAGQVGAIEFMEPGLLRGESSGRASDVWSLGASLHQVLCGVSVYGPLPRDSGLSALRHVLGTTPQLSAAVSASWIDVIRRCVAPDRADRYPTAQAVADAIDERVEAGVDA